MAAEGDLPPRLSMPRVGFPVRRYGQLFSAGKSLSCPMLRLKSNLDEYRVKKSPIKGLHQP